MPSLTQLAIVFARYANLTLGGGSATAAMMHRELVEKRHWLTDDQFTLSFALGRVTCSPRYSAIGRIAAAMATPALLIIPLVHFVGKKLDDPRIKGVLQTVVIASRHSPVAPSTVN